MNRTLGILTSQDLPNMTGGEPLLLSALEEEGIQGEILIWDGELTDHSHYLIRTTWDYYQRSDEFLKVIQEIESSGRIVFNPSEIVKWNMDKAYLIELYSEFPNYVPETFLAKCSDIDTTKDWLKKSSARKLVLKPRVSAAGFNTFLSSADEILTDFDKWGQVLQARDFLIQPYLPEVKEQGEVSLMYFDGVYSHSVLKLAKTGEFRVQDDHGGTVHPYTPDEALLAAAETVIAKFKQLPYLRVDFIPAADGPQLMELELIEPELFLDFDPDAPEKLARAITSRL